jgi:hypothetical protein
MACPCFKSLNKKKWSHFARRYCSRYNDKYIEWLPVAGMSTLTDDCKAILRSNQFNKIDAHYGQIRSTAKEGAKRRCLHCAKYNGLKADICIGGLGGIEISLEGFQIKTYCVHIVL